MPTPTLYETQGKDFKPYGSPERTALATAAGVGAGYTGTADQNAKIVQYLNGNKSTAPAPAPAGAPVNPAPNANPLFNPDNFVPTGSQSQTDLDAANAARAAAYGMDTNPNANDRSAATAMFQSQIDALNQVYAEQKKSEVLAGRNRLGSNTAIEARRGLLGSDFGAAATDRQVEANKELQDAIDAKHNLDLQSIYTNVNKSALDAAAARVSAAQKGADAHLEYIKGANDRITSNVQSAVKAYVAAGNDGSKLTDQNINDFATKLKTTPDVIRNAITEASTTAKKANLDSVKTQADIDKINQDITTGKRDLNKPIEVGGYIWKYDPAAGQFVNSGAKYDPTTAPGTPGATGSIPSDVQAVLEGRNTLYNIKQTVGKTNAGAAYMQRMRDAITAVDPQFDFIASDAGGKSVSSSYVQRATTAINSVLPNIQIITDLSNQIPRVGITGVDALLQKGNTIINNQKVANFHQAQKLIADEIGVALGAGTVSDMKLQLGFDVTDPSVSQEVFASNMKLVKDFLQNRKDGLNSLRYQSSTVAGAPTTSSTGVLKSPDGTQQVNISELTPDELAEAKSAGWK